MKLLYTSTDHAFTIQAQLALDEANIPFFCSDADSSLAGIGAAVGSKSRIYVLKEDDWSRAVELLQELSNTSNGVSATVVSPRRPFPAWLIFIVSLLTASVLGLAISTSG